MLDDLVRAREGFVLASDLHLVYLVTPTNVEVEPDWELYYERFMELPALEQVRLLIIILCYFVLPSPVFPFLKRVLFIIVFMLLSSLMFALVESSVIF